MANEKLRQRLQELFAKADVQIDGDRSWDFQVINENVFKSILCNASLGLGESFMDGWWECERLDEFFYRVLWSQLDKQVIPKGMLLDCLKARLVNFQKTEPGL